MTPQRLVIVESPTKATKIAGFLGKEYSVTSSRGHVRDLPHQCVRRACEIQGREVGAHRRERG